MIFLICLISCSDIFLKGAINDRAIEAESVDNQPAQCFLYDGCNRLVLSATEDCPLTK